MRKTILLLSAAALTQPAYATDNQPPAADSIAYALATTSVKVELAMVLEQCPTDTQPARVAPTLTVTPVAAAGETYRIGGRELRSWLKKRELSLALYDNGTVKSIGASASDRTAAVIGNVFKLGASLVTMGILGLDGGITPTCRVETANAIREMNKLKAELDNQRGRLAATTDPVRISAIKDAIDGLAARIVDLRSNALQLTVSQTIAAPNTLGDVDIKWPAARFEKWFSQGAAQAADVFTLRASFAPAAGYIAPMASEPAPNCASCPFLAIREPLPAKVTIGPLAANGDSAWSNPSAATASSALLIGQWGGISYFRLSAGFGQSRSLKLELDPFGRKTSIGLNSEARAEAITGALVGIADAALPFVTATSDAKQQATRISELETQQKYNKLMRCEAIIEAGGFTCPD